MKKTLIFFLVFFFLFSLANDAFALEWRKAWQDAKNNAEKDVKKITTPKIKKLSDVFKLAKKDLGPNLDKYQKIINEIKKNLSIKDVIKEKKYHSYFSTFTKKEYNNENWEFYMQSPKMKCSAVYEKWTKRGSKNEVNLPAPLFKAWEDQAKDNFKKGCKDILEQTRTEILKLLAGDIFPRFKIWLLQNYKKKDRDALKVKIFAAIKLYRKVVKDGMSDAKWKNNANVKKAGNTLLRELTKLEKTLKKK